jgi:CubicO group peptidase (beta-lactamase class C family)
MLRDQMALETKVADVFPGWDLPKGGNEITLRMLLQNKSGLAEQPDRKAWNRAFMRSGPAPKQRTDYLKEVLREPLKAAPGEEFIYSNAGFALAGAMIEDRAGRSWENLVRERIFDPLKLGSAGFGAAWSDDKIDQPWGHQFERGQPQPSHPMDNPVAIAPAGLIHMSVLDFARYAALHLAIARGEIAEFKEASADLYMPPAGSSYALGWLVAERTWAGGEALTHAGSNTLFHALVWIAPARNWAFVVCTNIGDRSGGAVQEGCDKVVGELIKRHLKRQQG